MHSVYGRGGADPALDSVAELSYQMATLASLRCGGHWWAQEPRSPQS